MNAYLLWMMGLVFIFLEFYLPGAILGVIGGILVFASLLTFASESSSVGGTLAFFLAVITSIILLIRFALWRIRTAKPEYSIYSNAHQEGHVASHFDKHAIGKTGVVLSDLKPGGFILIEGKQHQAISQSGYITKGEEVIVIGGQEESLLVQSKPKES